MVHHAKELPRIAGNQEPSTYVKVYLLPDTYKATKRKTKVVKKNCYPSFMEMVIILKYVINSFIEMQYVEFYLDLSSISQYIYII